MGTKKKVVLTDEQIYERNKVSTIKDLKEEFSRIGQAPNDRKIFTIGESVTLTHGGFISSIVVDVIEEGIYEVEIIYETNKPYSSEKVVLTRKRIAPWYDIFKLSTKECDIVLGDDLRLTFMQQQISSLIESYIIRFGTDFNPSYQRGLVWELEDEQKLIESIFNRVDIGKFVFIHLGYANDIMYEVLDGKQRLTALYRYYTDQFQYNGFYYSELPRELKYVFEDSPVAVACTRRENLQEKDILNYFIRLNTTGKPVDVKHLDKVKEQLNNIK